MGLAKGYFVLMGLERGRKEGGRRVQECKSPGPRSSEAIEGGVPRDELDSLPSKVLEVAFPLRQNLEREVKVVEKDEIQEGGRVVVAREKAAEGGGRRDCAIAESEDARDQSTHQS
jgi:hypothetical protein